MPGYLARPWLVWPYFCLSDLFTCVFCSVHFFYQQFLVLLYIIHFSMLWLLAVAHVSSILTPAWALWWHLGGIVLVATHRVRTLSILYGNLPRSHLTAALLSEAFCIYSIGRLVSVLHFSFLFHFPRYFVSGITPLLTCVLASIFFDVLFSEALGLPLIVSSLRHRLLCSGLSVQYYSIFC